tara:strand:+ start:8992 stop:13365 length:4374 start_codon:yes stop_codon:yes gene_type:complete
MSCSIIRNSSSQVIEGVFAENGKSSKLYKELVEKTGDAETALDKWTLAYVPEFIDNYKGERDENGEPTAEEILKAEPEGVERQVEVLKKLLNQTVRKTDQGYVEIETDTVVANRVTDLVQKYRDEIGAYSSSDTTAADIGTTVHLLVEQMFKHYTGVQKMSHKDMLDVVEKSLVASGIETKWVKSLDNKILLNLDKGVEALYKDILKAQDSIDPGKKPVILTEHMIHDKFKNLAGTIDALIVYSNGQVGMLDFKTMYVSKGNLDDGVDVVRSTKITEWNIQQSNYKEMIKTKLGIEDMRETRIIPIGVDYKNYDKVKKKNLIGDKIKAVNMAGTISTKTLDPVPVAGEVTGKALTDKAIKRLEGERAKLLVDYRATSDYKKKRVVEVKMSKVDRALQALRLYDDVKDVTKMASNTIQEITKKMNVVKKGSKSYLSANDIREYVNELKFYGEILKAVDPNSEDFEALKGKDEAALKAAMKSGEVKKVLDKTEALYVGSQVNNMISNLEGMLFDRMNEEAGSEIDLKQTGKKPGMWANFLGVSEVDSPVFKRLTSLFTASRDKAENDTFEDFSVIKEKHAALKEWAKSRGKNIQEVFDMMVNKKTMSLVTPATQQFYDDRDKAKENKDSAWFKKNTTFNVKKFEEAKKQEYSIYDDPTFDAAAFLGRRKKKNETDAAFKKRLDEAVEKAKQDFINRHDPREGNTTAYMTSIFLQPNVESGEYASDLYKEMHKPGNQALKDYYDMYTEMNEKFDSLVGSETKIKRNFIANVSQSMSDRMFELGPAEGITEMWNSFKHDIQVREQDEVLGRVDPATGKSMRSIPLLYTDEIRIKLSDKERNQLESSEKIKLEEEFKKDNKSTSTRDFEKALKAKTETAIAAAEYKKGKNIKSVDLTSSLMLMTNSVHKFSQMKNIEEDVLTLREILVNGDATETVVDEFGRPIKDKLMGKIAERIGISDDTLALFDKHVDFLLYGKKGSDIQLGGVSGQKVLNKMHSYLSLKALALNVPLGFASYHGAKSNLRFLAGEGRVFSQEDLKYADKLVPIIRSAEFTDEDDMSDDKIKAAHAVAFFRPSTRDLTYEESEKTSSSWGKQNMTFRNAFVLHRLGDDAIDNKILVSMMKSHGIDSTGNLVRRDRAKEGFTALLDMEFKNEKGKLSIIHEGKDVFKENPEMFTIMRNRVRKVAFNVKGSISEEQRAAMQGNMLFQMAMKFRSWMPGMVQSRFGDVKYDAVLDDLEIGRYRVFLGQLFQNGIGPALTNLKDVAIATMPLMLDHYKGRMGGKFAEKKYQEFLESNPHLRDRFTKEEFIQLMEDKMRGAIIEARTASALGALLLFLSAGLNWDDEDDNNIVTRNMFLMLKRTSLELSFPYSPGSVVELAKFPFPVMSLIKNIGQIKDNTIDETRDLLFGENSNRDSTPQMYFISKQIPLLNQVMNVAGLFNPSIYETEQGVAEQLIEEALED